MRRKAIFECLKQEAKFLLRLLMTETKQLKYLRLHPAIMNSDRPATQVNPIHHNVIRPRLHSIRSLLLPACLWAREWMMHSIISLGFFIIFKEGKIGHPAKYGGIGYQSIGMCHIKTQPAQDFPGFFIHTCHK